MSMPSTEPEGLPRKRNWVIIVAAIVVACCLISLCCGLAYFLYTSGDQWLSLSARLAGAAI